jgi:diketogulonate reductase-like aldo/keto reductase
VLTLEQEMETIPLVGYGAGTAWFKGPGHNTDNSPLDENQIQQTVTALECGFVHLDLAEVYGNDREIHEALQRYFTQHTDKKRSDLWITSKCFEHLSQPSLGCREILSRLECEYLDLYLLHCPPEFQENSSASLEAIWREMEALVHEGLVRFIGVSNFRICDLERLMSIATIPPFMNQVEFNPYLQQPDLMQRCQSFGIRLAAYSPLGPLNLWPGGPLDPLLEELSVKYGQSTSVILLKYTHQKGYLPITTTSKRERMLDYLSVFPSSGETNSSFVLSTEELERIDKEGSKQSKRKYWVPYFPATEA